MPPATECIYCGAKLVPFTKWWSLCPVCEPDWFPKVSVETEAERRERLLLDKGRPWRNGKPA